RTAPSCPQTVDSITALPLPFQQLLARVRDQGGEPELKLDLPSGAATWIAARHAAIAENMTVFILRDISEHKKLEDARAQLGRDQALAEMSAILAHEIRNPLGSLELFAELLADSGLDGERKQWVDRVQAGLRTLAATVNNVLHFHSMPRAEFSTVNAGELLEWVRNFCGPLAHQSGVTLSLQNHVPGLALRGDRHRLEQVLLNLVLNSIKAVSQGGSESQGWIEVSARRFASQLELAVSDNGPGIPPDCLPRILAPGLSTRSGSPGLGLAVCRKIVEQHGGMMRAENSPERGTRITLTLPMTGSEKDCS
ncbi:MAG TPA: ATP-binding protein, partial [Terriglobales bacterium]|nr:ATP-binding protein [Terriglobales bacterium]